MAKYDVAPTKSNLLNMKQQKQFAKEGHELLSQKRDILIAELLGMTDTAAEIEERVNKALREAYKMLSKAIVSMGQERLKELANGMPIQSDVDISTRKIMGISVPTVHLEITEKKPYYSFLHTDMSLDEAIFKFREILGMLGRLAQTRISVVRLAREAQKTTRRVNALEKIYLPDYTESIEYIQNMLDESERQAFFVLKLIKNKLKK